MRDKTYSEVMNEWAAQRSFVMSTRSRILHPPYDAPLAVRAFGYLWRAAVVVLVPLAAFLYLVKDYVTSKPFKAGMEKGVISFFDAPRGKLDGVSWRMENGKLGFRQLMVEDSPWFDRLDAKDMITEVPLTRVFRKQWTFERLSVGELTVSLKSGVAGAVPVYEFNDEDLDPARLRNSRPAGQEEPKPKLLRGGFGIDPDFKSLQLRLVQAGRLNLSWGGGGSTKGSLTGSSAELTKASRGWDFSAAGGEFSQSWMTGLKLVSWKAKLTGGGAEANEARFTQTGGGEVKLRGSVTFGQNPTLTGDADLTAVRLQEFLPESLSSYVQATASGAVKISGDLNGTTGVGLAGALGVENGRVTGLPVLGALQLVTGEDTYGVLNVRSGKADFTSDGGELTSGLKVNVSELTLNCEPVARLRFTGAYQRGTFLDLTTAAGSATKVTLTGTLKLGIQASAVGKMKPAVAQKFFSESRDGWHWLTIPVDGVNDPVSGAVAAEMIRLHQDSHGK